MTEQTPMTTQDMPGQPVTHKVKIGEREITLTEARAGMNPALAHQLGQQYPRAEETPELAQQMIDAYAAAHEREHGQPWTGQSATTEAAPRESSASKAAHDERTEQRHQDQGRRKRD